jgi:hypothetical protein
MYTAVERDVDLTLESFFREEREVTQECTTKLSVGIDPRAHISGESRYVEGLIWITALLTTESALSYLI